MKSLNKNTITLNDGEYALFSDIDVLINPLNDALEDGKEININGNTLKPGTKKAIEVIAYNQRMKNNICTIIVKDNIISGLTPLSSTLNLNYKTDAGNSINEKINSIIQEIQETERSLFNFKII